MFAYIRILKIHRLTLSLLITLIIITPIYAQINLSGSLSGVLESGDYLVVEDILIETGDSLVIEPGVSLYFSEDTGFTIRGVLVAVGEPGDSINFLAEDSAAGWIGIEILTPLHYLIVINYCTFQHAISTVLNVSDLTSLRLENSRFSYNSSINDDAESVIVTQGCLVNPIKHCVFSNNTNYLITALLFSDPLEIDSCIFKNNNGIIGGWGCQLELSNSVFINNSNSRGPFFYNVFSISIHNSLFIYNNLSDNSGLCSIGLDESFENNTVVYNRAGDECVGISMFGDGIIQNNIFYNNEYEFDLAYEFDANPSVEYNLFLKEDGQYFTASHDIHFPLPVGLGEIDTINVNGDSSDIYFNLFMDPQIQIFDSSIAELLSNSPCIDAGNPLSPFDQDSTIADIGHTFFSQNSVSNEKIYKRKSYPEKISIFPNPTNSTINIDLSDIELSNKRSNLSIYNILGELVQNINVNSSFISISETSSLTSGVYFIRLMDNQNIISESNFIFLK
ncbi:MAG: T9SS type A sorting domain-containing protein [Candidatus Electryonea clarkiae]|nr:T9SS type A sorting domain-containing protein [Candidatus Electryonea clarkiae]MDP8287054.1 T9SS type A sorting domain-containing protein [Candidatus Electryonea clarkiae]